MSFYQKCAYCIATSFYTGYIPLAPGTFASFLCLLVLFFTPQLLLTQYLGMIIGLLIIGVWAADVVERRSRKPDPSFIVIDEWVGMMIALAAVPRDITCYGIAFIIFRFFDIVKPYPIRCIQALSGGLAVMLDDVLAGLLTLATVHTLRFFLSGTFLC